MENTHANPKEKVERKEQTPEQEELTIPELPFAVLTNPGLPLKPKDVLQLQRTIGNQATIRLLASRGYRVQRQIGLADSGQREAYVQDTLRRVEPRWQTLSPEERLAAIMSAVNTRLGAIQVPGCGYELREGMAPRNYAHFDSSLWRIYGNNMYFDNTGDSRTAPHELIISGIYHEARHAEQRYLILRYVVRQLARTHDIIFPDMVKSRVGDVSHGAIERAIGDRSRMSQEELQFARRMYETIYGSDSTSTAWTYTRLELAISNLESARETGNQTLIDLAEDEFQAAHRAYESMPHEADAHNLGNRIEAQYRQMQTQGNQP